MKQMTTEAELWRDIARRLETGTTCFGARVNQHQGLCEILGCAYGRARIARPLRNRAEARLRRVFGPSPPRFGYWWNADDADDHDSRIIACGLLAAMAEEEEEDGV